ncbi:MAG TPA: flavodoxin [Candidatus Ozemobacteraceae bacterium]|nr:flavodoxin [Candidatus Ozemobacteraceae bacterium]
MNHVFVSLAGVVAVLLCGLAPLSAQPASGQKRMLVLYFSKTGNTKKLAAAIQKQTGADMVEIVPAVAYPEDYDQTVDIARKEQDAGARPAAKTRVENIASYDVVFLGYPSWWGTMPMAVFTFLEAHDLSGKTLVPFTTHEGSGFGRSVADLRRLCPKSTILDGLAIRGRDADTAETSVPAWLQGLKF